jgi:hypothetical protein
MYTTAWFQLRGNAAERVGVVERLREEAGGARGRLSPFV